MDGREEVTHTLITSFLFFPHSIRWRVCLEVCPEGGGGCLSGVVCVWGWWWLKGTEDRWGREVPREAAKGKESFTTHTNSAGTLRSALPLWLMPQVLHWDFQVAVPSTPLFYEVVTYRREGSVLLAATWEPVPVRGRDEESRAPFYWSVQACLSSQGVTLNYITQLFCIDKKIISIRWRPGECSPQQVDMHARYPWSSLIGLISRTASHAEIYSTPQIILMQHPRWLLRQLGLVKQCVPPPLSTFNTAVRLGLALSCGQGINGLGKPATAAAAADVLC